MTRVLMIVTNHTMIEDEPRTGVWFSEFADPFRVFVEAGIEIVVASPHGGPAPVDPRGYPSKDQIAPVRDALARLNATHRLDRQELSSFDGVFVPGGHGPMFDLSHDAGTKATIAAFWDAGKPVAAVCHGPAALLDVKLASGATLLHGHRVTGFTRGEDAQDELFRFMPFSLQDRMEREGATFVASAPHTVHTETDGRLVTGQNPASGEAAARAFLAVLGAH